MQVFYLTMFLLFQTMFGALLKETSLDESWLEIELNDDGHVSKLLFSDQSSIQYSYKNERIHQIVRYNPNNERLYNHTYEWQDDLLVSDTGWFTTNYIYDDKKRVINKISPWQHDIIEYNDLGQISRINHKFYTYDHLGQILSESGSFFASYDDECNLLSLNGAPIPASTHQESEDCFYDEFGRRTLKADTTYLYLGFEEIASFVNGRCKTLKVPGLGSMIAIEIDGKAYAPITDPTGIVRKLIDPATNSIFKEIDCDIFGFNLSDEIPYAYRGKRFDRETGYIYFGMRYYDPSKHRWTTPDPLGPIDHTNLYQYVFNNPLSFSDPIGCSFWGYLAGIGEIAAGCAIIAGGAVVEVATFGGFTIGLGVTTSAGCALIGHGLSQTTLHAKDLKVPDISWKNTNVYAPDRPLPNTPDGVHVPDTDAPHTQLGTQEGRKGKYPQAREFDENGNPVRDIDFTDHGRPQNHQNPHQHDHIPNPTGGTPERSKIPKPVSEWIY